MNETSTVCLFVCFPQNSVHFNREYLRIGNSKVILCDFMQISIEQMRCDKNMDCCLLVRLDMIPLYIDMTWH